MLIKKGTLLDVNHVRKGKFKGMATKDFDPDALKDDDSFPIAVAEGVVRGQSNDWVEGENVPCRKSLCKITVVK